MNFLKYLVIGFFSVFICTTVGAILMGGNVNGAAIMLFGGFIVYAPCLFINATILSFVDYATGSKKRELLNER